MLPDFSSKSIDKAFCFCYNNRAYYLGVAQFGEFLRTPPVAEAESKNEWQ
jgi:hypothetical protein